MRTVLLGFFIGLATAAIGPGLAQTPAQQPVPRFRAETSLVPLDIRVLDRNGKPITGLQASDFTVLENGVAQTVSHFSPVSLAVDAPPPDAAPLRRGVPDDAAPLAPQSHRVFLIVFGRGRLQHPSMGVDAAMTFVRERLLPGDQIAVMAYNRATDFTTDRTKLTGIVERFRDRHEHIEAMLQSHFSGWSAMYKGLMMPPEIQAGIDDVFDGPLAAREIPPGRKPD
jgi:VWFA-related protein